MSAPIKDAPWYLLATGTVQEAALPELIVAAETTAERAANRPILDLCLADSVDAPAARWLMELVEQGKFNVLVQPDRIAGPLSSPTWAVILAESRIEAAEALLAHVKDRRERGLEDSAEIVAALLRLRALQSA